MNSHPSARGSRAPRPRAFGTIAVVACLGLAGCGRGERVSSSGRAQTAAEGTPSARLEFRSDPGSIEPGRAARWMLRVLDADQRAVVEFEPQQETLVHLVVTSADLAWFNHLHPELGDDGILRVTTVLPRAGTYRLYAEFVPRNGSATIARTEIATGGGVPQPATNPPGEDPVDAHGWIERRTYARPESEPDAADGEAYDVRLMPMPSPPVAGREAMLHFQVRDAAGRPVQDLEPYLGAAGHAVVISADGSRMLHVHPMESAERAGSVAGGPDVMFHLGSLQGVGTVPPPRPDRHDAGGAAGAVNVGPSTRSRGRPSARRHASR